MCLEKPYVCKGSYLTNLRYEIEFFPDMFVQTTSQVSRLAVDDLPGSRMVNAEVIFVIVFEICFLRRLKVKSSVFVWLQKNFQRT